MRSKTKEQRVLWRPLASDAAVIKRIRERIFPTLRTSSFVFEFHISFMIPETHKGVVFTSLHSKPQFLASFYPIPSGHCFPYPDDRNSPLTAFSQQSATNLFLPLPRQQFLSCLISSPPPLPYLTASHGFPAASYLTHPKFCGTKTRTKIPNTFP